MGYSVGDPLVVGQEAAPGAMALDDVAECDAVDEAL